MLESKKYDRSEFKINYITDILYPLAIIIYMTPTMIWRISGVSTMFGRLGKLLFVAVLFVLFFRKRFFKLPFVQRLTVYFIYIAVVSFCISGTITVSFGYICQNLSLVLMGIYVAQKDSFKFSLYPGLILSIWVILNFLTWKEGGAYITINGQEGTFLGVSTSVTQFQIPAMIFLLLAKEQRDNSKKIQKLISILWWLDILSLLLFFIAKPCTTSMIVLVIMLIIVYVDEFQTKIMGRSVFRGKYIFEILFWGCILLNLGLVFGNLQGLFANWIETYLHESRDLNNRTHIWKIVLVNIAKHPIFGNGMDTSIKFSIGEHTSYNTSAHNQLLIWMFHGGCVGIIYILLLIHSAFARMRKTLVTRESVLISTAIVLFAILWVSEQMNYYALFFLCLVAAYNQTTTKEG